MGIPGKRTWNWDGWSDGSKKTGIPIFSYSILNRLSQRPGTKVRIKLLKDILTHLGFFNGKK